MDPLCFNLAVVAGTLSSSPRMRELASGDVLVSYEVTTRLGTDQPADSVPVSWIGDAADVADLDAGDPVVVTGRVRRRFYRAATGTQSRTEVAADKVIPAKRRRQVVAAVGRAAASLQLD